MAWYKGMRDGGCTLVTSLTAAEIAEAAAWTLVPVVGLLKAEDAIQTLGWDCRRAGTLVPSGIPNVQIEKSSANAGLTGNEPLWFRNQYAMIGGGQFPHMRLWELPLYMRLRTATVMESRETGYNTDTSKAFQIRPECLDQLSANFWSLVPQQARVWGTAIQAMLAVKDGNYERAYRRAKATKERAEQFLAAAKEKGAIITALSQYYGEIGDLAREVMGRGCAIEMAVSGLWARIPAFQEFLERQADLNIQGLVAQDFAVQQPMLNRYCAANPQHCGVAKVLGRDYLALLGPVTYPQAAARVEQVRLDCINRKLPAAECVRWTFGTMESWAAVDASGADGTDLAIRFTSNEKADPKIVELVRDRKKAILLFGAAALVVVAFAVLS